MKQFMLGAIIIAAIGIVGSIERQDQELMRAQTVCQNETNPQPCIDNNLEHNNDK